VGGGGGIKLTRSGTPEAGSQKQGADTPGDY
jgi:hypothetical protein